MSVLQQIQDMEDSPEKDFEIWWYNEGSGIAPLPKDDLHEHIYRVSKIAWLNGADKQKHK